MKKILSLSSAKILILCGLGLTITLGSFWHHQSNQSQMDRMNVLNQGVGTCFNRISQTFTAMMIKDVQSPYLNRGFMGLSDECLNETIKGINPFRKNIGKGYETLNQLISEVHWFHEKVLKIHAPMLAKQDLNPSLNPISEKFSKMEGLKVNLVDEIDSTAARIREIQSNDQALMGAGLILFVIGLSILSLKEFNRLQVSKEIEMQALNHLKAGQNIGAIVDQLIERALLLQAMPVTAQVFKDYHCDLLEKMAVRTNLQKEEVIKKVEAAPQVEEVIIPKTSLKEVMVSLQNVNDQDAIHVSEVRDVILAVSYESFEQIMNAAVNKLSSKRIDNKKIIISNQIHSDRSVISLFLAGNTFTASELEFSQSSQIAGFDEMDMNMMILKEMAMETGTGWHIENKTDRDGNITGMCIRLNVLRVPREKTKNLVSVMRGKKKDLARELVN